MSPKTIFRILALGGLLLAARPAAAAPPADAAEQEALRKYCVADVQRLCPGVTPGGGRIKACLASHKDQMSVGCAKALQALKSGK